MEERSTVVSSEQARMRKVLTVAHHAVAVVQDQVDGREMTETEEQKFVELTKPVADVTVNALMWSGQGVEAERLCTSVLDFLCLEQTERDADGMWERFDAYFQGWQERSFSEKETS